MAPRKAPPAPGEHIEGERFESLRKRLDWTQDTLAAVERSHVVSVSRRERAGAKAGAAYTLMEVLAFMKDKGVLDDYLAHRKVEAKPARDWD